MLARNCAMTVLDFESTGTVTGYPDEPWQLGLVQMTNGTVQSETCSEYLLRVGDRPFNRYAPGRHAELRHELNTAPRLPELWPELKERLGAPRILVAHNKTTELKFLRQAFPMQPFEAWVDTLPLVRMAYPGMPSHALGDVLAALELGGKVATIVPGREAHDALYDAVASAILLESLLAHPAWKAVSLRRLMSA